MEKGYIMCMGGINVHNTGCKVCLPWKRGERERDDAGEQNKERYTKKKR